VPVKVKYFQTVPGETKNWLKKKNASPPVGRPQRKLISDVRNGKFNIRLYMIK
jgi:hypothetical protein